ncbi:cytochrome c-type biogenesis protein CcmH [Roseibium sp. CAU 1637]|uniref:Cytochrome c-type biogenesis protein n=1 Tax=Roseibium limicola TaxID=2816037 RepID=A0A939J8S5_9HYPH|nr:cytochrome c-type biogenesis protein [Roseibium limicola]MBO0345174.1 cytochrome c-type biogenesis protein CcmH [Roseibium limicola]
MNRLQTTFKALLIALVLGAALLPSYAVTPDEILDDPVLEARARELSAELRCLVCQNQSIDDSDAELAKDLRVLVRQRLVAGDTDTQVIDYLVSRYGEFVLLKPRFAWHNAALWVVPPAALLLGIFALWLSVRRRKALAGEGTDARLSAEEEARLSLLIDQIDTQDTELDKDREHRS